MLAVAQGVGDDVLLDDGDLGKVDLHAHVAAGNHHAVGHGQDLIDVVHALLVLQLGDDAHVGVVLIQQAANLHHVLGAAAEGRRHKVKALLDAKEQVLPVLGAHVGHGQMHAGDVHALPVLDGSAVLHQTGDVRLRPLQHLHADEAVVQHDLAAGVHILGQVLVAHGADVLRAGDLAGGEGELLPGLQHDLALGKGLQANFRAFRI